MKTMEMKIDEVHFMLSHLMKDKPLVTGIEVVEYLGISSTGFMDIILDDSYRFPEAIHTKEKGSIFGCEWIFETVVSWKKRNSDTLAKYKSVSGDNIHERLEASYKKITGNS